MTSKFEPYVEYDKAEGIVYVYLSEEKVASTEPLDDLRIVDRDEHGQPVGVEFIDPRDGVDLRDVPERATIELLFAKYNFPIVV